MKNQVNLTQEELLTIVTLLDLNVDNEDFTEEEREEFSDLSCKLSKYLDIR